MSGARRRFHPCGPRPHNTLQVPAGKSAPLDASGKIARAGKTGSDPPAAIPLGLSLRDDDEQVAEPLFRTGNQTSSIHRP